MIEYTVQVYANGDKHWYLEGKLHREDGPALECADGAKFWYLEGKLHREDGPALECADGYRAWYLRGKEYTKTNFLKKMNPKPTCEGKVIEVDGIRYKLMKE